MATEEQRDNRPARLISKKTLEKQAKVVDERKKHALMDTHEVILNDGWKHQEALWRDATYDERCSIIYGMVIHDGAISVKDITRFFAITAKDLEPFAEVYDMAKAALKLKIQRNQISMGLQREDSAPLKFNLCSSDIERMNATGRRLRASSQGESRPRACSRIGPARAARHGGQSKPGDWVAERDAHKLSH